MTIESRNIPSASEILEYVPSSTYVKNQMSNNRRIVKISPDNNNLRGSTFPNNAIANFTIPYSTSVLLNLSECYFDISGVLTPYLNDNMVADGKIIGKFKAGPFWLLPSIQRATLKIGGEVIYDNLLPFRTGKFKEMMYYNYNDKQNQSLDYQNIPKLSAYLGKYITIYTKTTAGDTATTAEVNDLVGFFNSISNLFGETAATAATGVKHNDNIATVITSINGKITSINGKVYQLGLSALSGVPNDANNLTKAEFEKMRDEINANVEKINVYYTLSAITPLEILSITDINLTPYFQIFTENGKNKIAFQQYLKLSDLFPCESMKPIFGQSVVLTLNFESTGYNGIAVDTTDDYNNFRIEYFTQYNFNTITYNLNVDMVNKLNQIYSKPVLEIIDDITVWDGSLMKTTSNGTIQLKVPISVNFETDMCCIILPQSASNILQLKQKFNETYANTTCHTIMDYRFINIQRIDVYADSDLIYTHNYADTKVYPGNLINNIINIKDIAHLDINNFIPAYHLYKECRWCCGSDEKGAIPYNDFLTCGFMICVPMSAFSRISTSAQLQINITMGQGVDAGTANHPTMMSTSYSDATPLDNIRVITKAKKGIVFEQLDKCSLKTITQSFDQEINVEIKPETQ